MWVERLLLLLVVASSGACGPGQITSDGPTDGATADAVRPDAALDGEVVGPDAGIPPGDGDGDGLDDRWEAAAGDSSLLDPLLRDTDGDGTPDGAEDHDGDGLTNADELAAGRLRAEPDGSAPDPFRIDLLVELDTTEGRQLDGNVLREAVDAFAALPLAGVAGRTGVGLHVYPDETSIPAADLADDNALRRFLGEHGPRFRDAAEPPLPVDRMVHVGVVTRRSDAPTARAQTTWFASADGSVEETGVLIYYDALDDSHPACAGDITLEAALAAAFIHEIGHTLQLGHDTDVGGGINPYNIMALASSCPEAVQRFLGLGNDDDALGATEAVGASRFSRAAADLMDFTNKLSVEASRLVDDDGVEM